MNLLYMIDPRVSEIPSNFSENQRAVYQIQLFLRELSFVNAAIPHIIPDGIFGPQTTGAVIQFQLLKGLPPTGVVDYQTWTILTADYVTVIKEQLLPLNGPMFPQNGRSVTLDDRGDAVYFIQLMLRTLSRHFNNIPSMEITGIYNQKTQEAIARFQIMTDLPSTGDTDKATWNRLIMTYGSVFTESDLLSPPDPS